MTSRGVSDVLWTEGKRVCERSVSLRVLIYLLVDDEDFVYFLLGVKGSHLPRGMRVEKALSMRLWRGFEIIERL